MIVSTRCLTISVSIPSRGFWFFEGEIIARVGYNAEYAGFQSPRGDFGFLKVYLVGYCTDIKESGFQSPRGDFGFLKRIVLHAAARAEGDEFQSPRGDFGFLKLSRVPNPKR